MFWYTFAMTHEELVAASIRSGGVAAISLIYGLIRDYGRRRGSTRKRIAKAYRKMILRRRTRKATQEAVTRAVLQSTSRQGRIE